ncbi:MAG TPA: PAS domain S-box protein [Actinomycetota bacterium]|nr:PAS domain S-box protein [Actinomycetota bacterium]
MTAQQDSRTELVRQIEGFAPVLEISPTAIVVTDVNATVVAWNSAATRLFGYTGEEAIGQNLDDLVAKTKELHKTAAAYSERAIRKDRIEAITRRTHKDGTLVDVEVRGAPLLADGEAIGTFVTYHDVTELHRQMSYYEALLEVSPTAIITIDTSENVTSWNPAAEALFGYTAGEAIGRNIDGLVANREEVREEALDLSRRIAREEVRIITRRTRKDGSLVDVEVTGAPIHVGGKLVGMYALFHDITELQEKRRYFQSIVEISPAAIVVTDPESKVVSWNPAAEKLFGYTTEEAVGRLLDDLVATRPELNDEAVAYSQASLRGERVQAISHRTRKDGSLVDVQLVSAPVVGGEEPIGFLAIYHDISEIQRQKRYYEALVESSPVAIALLDPEGTVHSWNPAAERLFWYSAEEAIGQHVDDLVAASEEIRAEARDYTGRGMAGELVHAITRRTRKDRSMVDVEMFSAPVIVAGEPAGIYAMYHDISELQHARRDAEAATQAKSAFLATMSHEIRTPLNAVIGMTGLLLDTVLGAEQRNYVEVIRNSGDALLAVINDILDFSKIEAGRLDLESVPFDLRECVESALELLAAGALKKGLDVAYELDPGVPRALVGDPTRVRQIMINLLNNAVKFTERGEVVLTVGADPLRDDGSVNEGRRPYRLHFAVRDTGIGIPEDRMERLFESFSQVDPSTTRRYGGTGLGLAISKRLAEQMGGTMWAESKTGEGSTFHFTIEAESAAASLRAYEGGGVPQLEGRRVLIVDDNATNRHILTRQTQSWGMLPREIGSPAEALDWVRRGDPFDLAILDMQMPEMDGFMLAREIRRLRDARSLPLVMLTSLGRLEQEAEDVEFAAFLTKPIKPSQLFDTVMTALGAESPREEPSAVGEEADAPMAELTPLRLLVVEDNAVNQQLALLMLQKVGYRADVAANGVEALEAVERQPYDVVLMDVEMPEMDGLEATRRIHQRLPKEQRPHIIAVTANAMAGERELCLQAGMDDYITKPIRIEKLAAALAKATPRAGAAETALDPAVIERMVASFGDDGGVAELIDTFLDHVPEQLATLRTAVEVGDADEARRGAHTLKSNAATFGASSLAELCRELEAAAKANTLGDAADVVTRIQTELQRVTRELRQARERLVR